MQEEFWDRGVRFECQRSGKCCTARGDYGYVYVNLNERRALAKLLGLNTSGFTRRHCQRTDGLWHLRDPEKNCQFLKDGGCRVYRARPTQCRTWPFWPENLNVKGWRKNVVSFCPGANQGRVVPPEEIIEAMFETIDAERQR